MKYDDVRHACALPSTEHLPYSGERGQVIARWRCPECKQWWAYAAEFLHKERFFWSRRGGPSWRWKRAERRRLAQCPITPQ